MLDASAWAAAAAVQVEAMLHASFVNGTHALADGGILSTVFELDI
jgi:hypothetical protein